jgi:hypothetical protein
MKDSGTRGFYGDPIDRLDKARVVAHWVRVLSCVSLSDPTHSVCACTEYPTVARRSMLLYHGPTAGAFDVTVL